MSTEEVARFVEERAALEDAKEHEADYEGARGKGPYLRTLARELRTVFADSANVAIKADRDEPKERRPAWLTRTDSTCNNCGGSDHRTGRCHLASDNFYERGYLAGLEAASRKK